MFIGHSARRNAGSFKSVMTRKLAVPHVLATSESLQCPSRSTPRWAGAGVQTFFTIAEHMAVSTEGLTDDEASQCSAR